MKKDSEQTTGRAEPAGEQRNDTPAQPAGVCRPCEPCVEPKRETCEGCGNEGSTAVAPRITMEPRKEDYRVPPDAPRNEDRDMTVGEFVAAFGRYVTESMADAPLRINGVTVKRDLAFVVRVRNEQVFVDLQTQEA